MATGAGGVDGAAVVPAGVVRAAGDGPAPDAPGRRPAEGGARRCYLQVLAWAFALFNSIRMVAYLPTLWAIHASGDSSQHSLLTWLTWIGANLTMAGWLYERAGQRIDRAVAVNLGNASMCITASAMIVWYRL